MIKRGIVFVLFLLVSLVVYSQSERKYIRKGNNEFENKDYTNSEIAYRKAVAKEPGSFEAQFNIGDALYKQEKYKEAAQKFGELANSDISKEKRARVYHNLGNALLNAGKLKESVEAYKQALKNNPDDIETKHNLTYALRKLKQQQEKQNKQNKDQKDKNNKDQQKKNNQNNKDKDKQSQQNQQDQQQKKKQDPQKDQNKKNQQQQQQKPEISKEDAKRLLQALENDEKKLQKKLKKKKARQAQSASTTKNW